VVTGIVLVSVYVFVSVRVVVPVMLVLPDLVIGTAVIVSPVDVDLVVMGTTMRVVLGRTVEHVSVVL